MLSLSLYFEKAARPELVRSEFEHPQLDGRRISVRGKDAGPNQNYGSFQWTPGVKALCYFFIRELVLQVEAPLSGYSGSLASSIDYALSKQPTWLCEMFGWDESGSSLLRKLINRHNSNLKRPGPVSLALRSSLKQSFFLKVFLDGIEIRDPSHIEQIANSLCGEVNKESEALEGVRGFESSFQTELENILFARNIFNPTSLKTHIDEINSHASFRRVVGKDVSIIDDKFLNLSAEQRLGTAKGRLKPFSIFYPISGIGCQALFRHMKSKHFVPVKIRDDFSHAVDILGKLMSGSINPLPEAIMMGIGPAATLLNNNKQLPYVPLMLLPPVSHRVSVSEASDESLDGEYAFLSDEPSTCSFYFDDLTAKGLISKKRSNVIHMEPDEIFAAHRSGDSSFRTISFFPYFVIEETLAGAKNIHSVKDRDLYKDSVLFVREDYEQKRELEVAIRNAWLDLLASKEARTKVVREMFSDQTYLKSIYRYSGIYNLAYS